MGQCSAIFTECSSVILRNRGFSAVRITERFNAVCLTETDDDLVTVCGRPTVLCLEWDDRPEVCTRHGFGNLAGSTFRRDALVRRADSHDINGTVCTGCREISAGIAIIIDVTHTLIEALTACKSKDRAS